MPGRKRYCESILTQNYAKLFPLETSLRNKILSLNPLPPSIRNSYEKFQISNKMYRHHSNGPQRIGQKLVIMMKKRKEISSVKGRKISLSNGN